MIYHVTANGSTTEWTDSKAKAIAAYKIGDTSRKRIYRVIGQRQVPFIPAR